MKVLSYIPITISCSLRWGANQIRTLRATSFYIVLRLARKASQASLWAYLMRFTHLGAFGKFLCDFSHWIQMFSDHVRIRNNPRDPCRSESWYFRDSVSLTTLFILVAVEIVLFFFFRAGNNQINHVGQHKNGHSAVDNVKHPLEPRSQYTIMWRSSELAVFLLDRVKDPKCEKDKPKIQAPKCGKSLVI